ncbi:TonB-dependent outer membrane receptor, SusC/RagA subfamily, signature region [Chitinophaga filiformis]|uniref:TonB-dependent outer membrane receptor, SusC/RagA subfamily, signature region n=1 Tax=Chitinophaga filiformis TaxID=104663 RepID=A0A1G7N5N7_CHIFI|nr:TonB-dependent outer membrane receptor, SusC/RagA subfamily, signature region [Chitinophaga filiformis]
MLLFLLSYFTAGAQHSLSQSRRTSVHDYLYELRNEETLQIHAYGIHKVDSSFLHTLNDSFPHNSKLPERIPPGNYLRVYAENDKLQIIFIPIPNAYPKLLNNARDLIVILHDQKGNLIKDAEVRIGKYAVPYDAQANSWRLEKYEKGGILEVYHKGVLNCTILKRSTPSREKKFWQDIRKMTHSSVFSRKRERKKISRYWSQDDYYTSAHEKRYLGYLVSNKPKFKPGDTVKLKAFITDKKGRPVNKPLLLRLSDRAFITDTILTTLMPYSPGAYTYEFACSPKMNLDLDENYRITLETTDSRKYDLNTYEGDLDEEEYVAKRKILARTGFRLEEYELHALSFKARTKKTIFDDKEQIAIYCQARDENDLPVMDGTIQLSITTDEIEKYYENDMLIPDTLWQYSGPMDAIGETKIVLPDSIFPKLDFQYKIDFTFTNSNYERRTLKLLRHHYYGGGSFSFELKSDSLYITQNGSCKHEPTNIYGITTNNDTIETFSVIIPAAIKINPFISTYKFKSENIEDQYTFHKDNDLFHDGTAPINYNISWSNDTTTVKIENPQKLFFWYYIFEHSKIVSRGYGNTLTWSGPTDDKQQYELRISYIWGGKLKEQFVSFADPGHPLAVSLAVPPNVYPGQTTEITVNVKDKYQRPVAGADLTAYAYTSKFKEEDDPRISFYQTPIWKRKLYYSPHTASLSDLSHTLTLDWKQYKNKMGLDSLLFFRFTHPSPYFIHTEPAADTITQIAPFVFSGGSIHPVHILSVDEIPVYCSLADPLQAYSVRVTPGDHWICLRTLHQRISFNLKVSPGLKTFISIDSAIRWPDIRVEKVPEELTEAELRQINRYMLHVRNTFSSRPAYIMQDGHLHWLNGGRVSKVGYRANYVTGPLTGKTASLVVKDYLSQDFMPEPGYAFEIRQGLIKQKQIGDLLRTYKYLNVYRTDTSLSAMVWSRQMADSLLYQQELDELRETNVLNERYSHNNKNKLIIDLSQSGISSSKDVLQYFFFRGDDPSFARSYGGSTNHFSGLDSGYYKLLVLLRDRRYFIKDSILFKANTLHYYAPNHINILPADSSSIELEKRLRKIISPDVANIPQERTEIAEDFNKRNFNTENLTRTIYGLIVNGRGQPIPGASVVLRGTPSACRTDAKGWFQLRTTSKGFLMVSSIGYQSIESPLTNNDTYKITLTDIINQLKETVVVAYATTTRRYNTGNIARIKTDMISMPGGLFQPQINGVNSITSTIEPLIIVNGVPFAGKLSELPPDEINSLSMLKNAEATGIYGSRGANGVILITTRPRNQNGKDDRLQLPAVNTLRTNFRDDAFWQPRLRTDESGNASFKVTFPDDITSWDAYAIAMTDKKQVGMRKIQIRSFKALSGNLALPLFAVRGDSIHIISKALNYTPDSIRAIHTFSMNDSIYKSRTVAFKNTFIDTIPVFIQGTDSISFKYTLDKEGYIDGEQRKIPVIERGAEETKGFFTALYNDTALSYVPARQEPVMMHAESAILPVLLDEITQVQQYKYLCNEQLASKLKTYLLEKKVFSYLKKDFKKDSNVKDILKQLDQQKKDGLWGWWENSPVSLWTSRHVIEALLMAEEQGQKTNFNKQIAIDHFVYELDSDRESDRVGCLQLLALLGAKINYRLYIDNLIARSGKGGYDTIGLAVLQQKVGLSINVTPILSREKNTAMGNSYWGTEGYDLFDNSIQKTLQVYKLLRQAGGYESLLQKIRGYFLEQRKDGHWRNTYESSLILETILPDILEDESKGPVSLNINGTTISQFPYTDTLTQAEKISISKQGKRPVYFTAYQQFFNRQPEKVSGLFAVSSVFSNNDAVQQDLKAGVPVTLKVEVTAQKTADYVLVEIPIPAGCSYNSKSQSWASHEVHREHFKDRVSIFCSQLSPGKHTFYVSLLPRYSGRYYLNPAKAEMQYFPIFMGREALKKVNIH